MQEAPPDAEFFHHGSLIIYTPKTRLADRHVTGNSPQLATELGDVQSAGAHFESALSITAAQPDAQAALNATKIEIGLAQGNMEFSDWMMTAVNGLSS